MTDTFLRAGYLPPMRAITRIDTDDRSGGGYRITTRNCGDKSSFLFTHSIILKEHIRGGVSALTYRSLDNIDVQNLTRALRDMLSGDTDRTSMLYALSAISMFPSIQNTFWPSEGPYMLPDASIYLASDEADLTIRPRRGADGSVRSLQVYFDPEGLMNSYVFEINKLGMVFVYNKADSGPSATAPAPNPFENIQPFNLKKSDLLTATLKALLLPLTNGTNNLETWKALELVLNAVAGNTQPAWFK